MARFEDTAAADIDLDEIQASSGTVFVKLAELEEIEFIVISAKLVPSSFNEKNTTAEITFVYPDQDTETDDAVYQVSSEQKAIKIQVQRWIDGKQKFPVEGCTVRIYAGPNSYGKYSYSLAAAIPAEEEEKPAPKKTPVQRDLREDTNRGRLSSRPVGRTLPKGR